MALFQINKNPRTKDLRLFAGLWFPLFFALIGFQVWRRTDSMPVAGAIWATAALISLLGLAVLPVGRLLYIGMSAITFPIGWALSHVILGAVFFGVFTPVGLVMHALGYDPMKRKLDRSAKSYWITCDETVSVERYFRQY